MGTRAIDPVRSLDARHYLGTLDAEPATTWPAAAEQLARAEEDAARYHEDFVAQCERRSPEAGARAFDEERQAGPRLRRPELRRMLG